MKSKKIIPLSLLVLTSIGIGYFFIKPQDYRIVFKVNTFPGVINQTLKLWHSESNNALGLEQYALGDLKQQFNFNDSLHEYHWRIKPIHDSLSEITVDIKDSQNSVSNRWQKLIGYDAIGSRSKKTVLDFIDKLNDHIQNFRIHSIEEVDLPTTFYAYISIAGKQTSKARGMMANISYISNFLFQNKVELNGSPFITVEHWDQKNDSIRYNFCFPIKRSDKLPVHEEIKYKKLFAKKALKVEFNGNYIYSDRAWYALLNYATKNNIEIEPTPIESFYNNPNMGGNELNWKALIYMPIKEETIEF